MEKGKTFNVYVGALDYRKNNKQFRKETVQGETCFKGLHRLKTKSNQQYKFGVSLEEWAYSWKEAYSKIILMSWHALPAFHYDDIKDSDSYTPTSKLILHNGKLRIPKSI